MVPEYRMWNENYPNHSRKDKTVPDVWAKKQLGKAKKLHSSSEDFKYRSLTVYMHDILKSSLITSFPEITLTKSWTKKVIKIIVFLLCLVGFIYQTLDFLWLYLSYPTVVNVLISNPFEVPQPAITICNKNRERRIAYCSFPGNKCSFNKNATKFCNIYPKYCAQKIPPFTGTMFPSFFAPPAWTWEKAFLFAHNDSMIVNCVKTIEGVKQQCRKPYRAVPAVMSVGEPNICYAIESLWGNPSAEPETHPNTFTIELTLNTQPEEYVTYTEPVLIQVAVHDSRKLVNPFAGGKTLKGGVIYDGTVTMTEKKLLEAPYDTNCTDYFERWKQRNGTGPVNDLICIEYCKLNTLLERGECIDKNVAYPHTEKLCGRYEVTTTSGIIENCTKNCGKPCSDYQYGVSYAEVDNFDHVCTDEWCKVAHLKLTLYFKQFQITKFQYQPKFESVEMFSYIGGYMGMWLGLSLVSLFDFIQTIGYLLYFPVGHLKWKMKKNKKTKPALNTFRRYPYYGSHIY